ncbi:hypothetical protein B0H14DRAFT_3132732 [Mycena olivaceomarginata]|nr:hypothetical protein B0H14DRAFT_3132732 [Mycena olivaceomarginata]
MCVFNYLRRRFLRAWSSTGCSGAGRLPRVLALGVDPISSKRPSSSSSSSSCASMHWRRRGGGGGVGLSEDDEPRRAGGVGRADGAGERREGPGMGDPNFLPLHASNDPENPPETFLNCQMDGNPPQPPIKLVRSYRRHPAPQVIPVIDLAPLTSLPSGGGCARWKVSHYFNELTESDTGTSITVYGTVATSNLTSQPIWSFAVDGPVMSTYTPHDNIRRAPPGALDVAVLVHRERLSPARGHADARARMVPVGRRDRNSPDDPDMSSANVNAAPYTGYSQYTAYGAGPPPALSHGYYSEQWGPFAILPDPHSSSNVATAGVSHNDPDSPNSASGSHRNASPMPSTSYPSVSHHAPSLSGTLTPHLRPEFGFGLRCIWVC